MSAPALRVENLGVELPGAPPSAGLRGVDLELWPQQVVGLVGPSAAGKSLLAWGLLGLAPPGGHVIADRFELGGAGVDWDDSGSARRRGAEIALMPQSPREVLDPMRRVGEQLLEHARVHGRSAGGVAAARDALAELKLGEDAFRAYPHQLSGGMAQRALLALTLLVEPAVIVADEPTSALDLEVTADVVAALSARVAAGAALLLVSHDLDLVGRLADRVLVLAGGRIVEEGPTRSVLEAPRHPVTAELVALPGPAEEAG